MARERIPSSHTQWLGATSAHSRDGATPALIQSIAALCAAYPQLRVMINLFDTEKIDAGAYIARHAHRGTTQLEGFNVPGMKPLFWKLKLTPAVVRGLQVLTGDFLLSVNGLSLVGCGHEEKKRRLRSLKDQRAKKYTLGFARVLADGVVLHH